jgi:hemerythrin-like metal-binding protein
VNQLATHPSAVAGIQAMDDQHGIFLDTLNTLRQQLARGQRAVRIHEQLIRLGEFTEMHFGCEESLLRRYEFPELDAHCMAHLALMNHIWRAVDSAERGEGVELLRMLGFVRGQCLEHVKGLDREYSEWLNAKGVY